MLEQEFESHIELSPENPSPIVILCDHATNIVPNWVNNGDLGLAPSDMARHIAYDIGALGVSRHLAAHMNAHLLATQFSRLVIDPNRGEDDPTLIMKIYDKTIINANHKLSEHERAMRLERLYRPYHRAISARLDAIRVTGQEPLIISMHSFTKQLRGREERPWHIGVLSADDRRFAEPLIAAFAARDRLVIGDNEPYHGALEGDTMDQHGIHSGTHHALIEIRNDLIETKDDQEKWADICYEALTLAMKEIGVEYG